MFPLINDFISTRGVSGSSRGAELIRCALAGSQPEVVGSVTPPKKPKTRLGRLLQMLTWDFITAPREAARLGADLIVHATNTGRGSRGVKSVIVMHDTMVLDHPSLFNKWFVLYARMTFGVSAKAADLIVTPSRHSASRIAARWPHTAGRIRVIPWPAPQPGDVSASVAERRRKPTVLVVASMDQHKRLGLAVEVVARLRKDRAGDIELHMVVRAGNDEDVVLDKIELHDPEGSWVVLHRQLSEADLLQLYATSSVTLVPSLDEGFCLPAIESIARGTPVVHAGRGALTEVIPMYPAASEGQSDSEVLYQRLSAVFEGTVARRQQEDFQEDSVQFATDTFRSRWLEVINELSGRSCT